MKILVAPDSFKGSLSAREVCETVKEKALQTEKNAEIDLMPLADGGEGTLECLMTSLQGKKEFCKVKNSLGEEVSVPVGFFDGGKIAVIESALANGLPQIKGRENPMITSTFGVGQMIDYSLSRGVKKIILTLGGSSTNDCGLGMLCALGAAFYDKKGNSFIPSGGSLLQVEDFNFLKIEEWFKNIKVEAMCDVENPLCGEKGCSAVFAPQKGADSTMVKFLEEGCLHIKDLFFKKLGKDFSEENGAGAAGGLGFAVISALKGTLKSGIDTVLDLCGAQERIKNCDLIITGEGCFDEQSLMGKTIGGLLKRCGNIPVQIYCGKNKNTQKLPANVKVIEISKNQPLEYALSHGKENLAVSVIENLK